MVIFHIYGVRTIFLLFFDHQDTESELREIKIGVPGPIVTPENISKAIWDNDIYTS